MLGKLTIEALPFYSWVAMGGALVTVGGALTVVAGITWLGQWRYLWSEWLTSVDHKRIGIMYVTLALIMLMRGFIDAMMMRSQQAIALNSDGYLPPEHFDQIFSSHGTIMIFFMAMPFLTGLINIVVPQQIGARDVAFPFMNSVSLWLTTAGAGLVMASLVIGKFSTAGWTGYPPYSGAEYSPGVGVDYWLWAILISGIGTTLTGINFVVTILKRRAPGMNLMRMPLFTWTALCSSVLMAFAFPALTVVCALLWLDRTIRHAFLHSRRRRQHDELCQPVLDMGPSGGLHLDPACVRHLFGSRRNVLRQAAVRLHITGLCHGVDRDPLVHGLAASFLHNGGEPQRQRLFRHCNDGHRGPDRGEGF